VKRAALILAKDLRVLGRTPALLAILLAYPLVIAALVGLVAGYGSAKPRVALVDEDGLPKTLVLAGHRFDVDRTIARVSREVRLVRLGDDEAQHELETGRVIATLTVPPGFIATLRGMAKSPQLELRVTQGGLAPRVRQQVQALVYSLNRELQDAFVEADLRYVELIRHGGRGGFQGQQFELLGLDGTERLLDQLPQGPRLDAIREFVQTARLALGETGAALRATAAPIELVEAPEKGRSAVLSAQVQAYALALTISFLALVLAAGALAGERDENALGRLARGLVGLGELVAAKVGLAAIVSCLLGLGVALTFGLVIEIGHVEGGEPWGRLPLLAAGLLLAGGSLGALGAVIGALSREARTASLVALMIVLPVVMLGLVPSEVFRAAGWASDALPFAHAVRLFAAALFDLDPWGAVTREAAWLIGLGVVFAGLARVGMRRLVA
jgi:ABC-type transport system involved in cytochrome c biogenesis permease component